MNSFSRKAQLDTFAHHRAALMFSKPAILKSKRAAGKRESEPLSGEAAATLKGIVRAGLRGFVPSVAPTAS